MTRRARGAAAAVLRVATLLVCGVALVGVATQQSGQNVLLVTIDTLRADHVGLYGYARPTTPHIDAWFGEGRVFERAYSTEANTSPSVASILTGLLPQEHGVRMLYQLLPDHDRLLSDLLPAAFQTAAVVSNSVLSNEAMGMARRFGHYDDFVDESEPYRRIFERNAEKTTEAAIRWLREERVPGLTAIAAATSIRSGARGGPGDLCTECGSIAIDRAPSTG